MIGRPPRPTPTAPLFPDTTLFRSRGHGASDAPEGDYTIAELAADALCVLDAAGARTASACGLSLGGMTALQLALAAPERISEVTACNTSRSEEPTSELQSLMRISYAVFCLKKKTYTKTTPQH